MAAKDTKSIQPKASIFKSGNVLKSKIRSQEHQLFLMACDLRERVLPGIFTGILIGCHPDEIIAEVGEIYTTWHTDKFELSSLEEVVVFYSILESQEHD